MHKSTSVLLLASWLLFFVAPASATVINIKINDPIAVIGDSIAGFQISADNQYAVYTANHEREEVRELYAVTTVGGTPVKLNPPINESSDSPLHTFAISPDSSRVVFIASLIGEPENQLYGVPIAGGTATRLSPGTDPVHSNLAFTSDGQHLIYYQGPTFGGNGILYRADFADGSQTPLLDLAGTNSHVVDFLITPADDQVVVKTNSGGGLLMAISFNDGSISSLGQSGNAVQEYALSADNRVVFRARSSNIGAYELYSNSLDGDDLITINDPLVTYGSVHSFVVSPTNNRVVYVADQDTYDDYELYGTTTGGGPSVKLQSDVDDISRRTSFHPLFTPDGSTVLYDYGPHLYAIAPTGGTATTLSPTLPYADAYSGNHLVTPDGNSVVFAMEVEANQVDIYISPLATGVATSLLNAPFTSYAGPNLQYLSTFNGDNLLFLAQYETDAYELFQVPFAGGTVTKVSAPTQADYGVGNNFEVSVDGQSVFYQADQEHPDFIGIYKATVTSRTPDILRLDSPQSEMTDVLDYRVAPDEAHVVYRGAMDQLGVVELYVAPMSGGGAVKLSGALVDGGTVDRDYLIASTSSHVVYKADQRIDDVVELYSVPLAGGPTIKLNPNLNGAKDISQFIITPGGAHVLYIADQAANNVHELFKVPIGGGTAVRVNHVLPIGASLDDLSETLLISPDGNYVTYKVVPATGSASELYIAPLNGGTPVHVTDGVSFNFGSQTRLFSADSSHLYYFGTPVGELIFYVYQVPVSGGTPTPINPVGTSIRDFGLTATQVIYLDRLTDTLFSIPIAGGSEQLLANNVEHIAADITGERVVFYEIDIGTGGDEQLASILSDGSDRQTLIATPDSSFNQYDYEIVGNYLLATNGPSNSANLVSIPLDGGTEISLSGALPAGQGVLSYSVSQDKTYVGFSGRIDSAETFESYIAPITGGTIQKVNQPTADSYGVSRAPYVCNSGACAVVHGDLDKANVEELFSWPDTATPSAIVLSNQTAESFSIQKLSAIAVLCLITVAHIRKFKHQSTASI